MYYAGRGGYRYKLIVMPRPEQLWVGTAPPASLPHEMQSPSTVAMLARVYRAGYRYHQLIGLESRTWGGIAGVGHRAMIAFGRARGIRSGLSGRITMRGRKL